MRWFKEKEFACKCCGELPPLARASVEALVREVLDPVREKMGRPIVVNSGYRCEKHNKEVGGVRNSQHMLGQAADIRPVACGKIIEELGVFDQLIYYPTFVHVSYKPNGLNRRQVLWHR